ncbi:MAG: response regulator [Paracoccaceae bacterium]|nr:response regulator [Paracoccaceae bacterium]
MTQAAHSLALVEDDEPVRTSLCAVLESWGFSVEAFEDGESFLASDWDRRADCILLDVRLPGIDGISVLSKLTDRGVAAPVVILTGHGDISMAVEALRIGAKDFIEKPFDDDDLVQRVNEVIETSERADRDATEHRGRIATLTPREADVFREVVAGCANKVIAHRLGLSPKTVEIHRARVMEKTGATNLSQLVRMALKAGIDPDT